MLEQILESEVAGQPGLERFYMQVIRANCPSSELSGESSYHAYACLDMHMIKIRYVMGKDV